MKKDQYYKNNLFYEFTPILVRIPLCLGDFKNNLAKLPLYRTTYLVTMRNSLPQIYLLVLFLVFSFNNCSQNSEIDNDSEESSEVLNDSLGDSGISENEMSTGENPDNTDNGPVIKDERLPTDIDSSYVITFEDEFNQQPGTLPDANKWVSQLPWGPDVIINNERQYYTNVLEGDTKAPNPFDFDGNNLVITVGLNNEEQVEATGQDYYSGVLTGFESTPYRNGYIEANIYYDPDVQGFWGAFWLLNRYYDFPQNTGENGKYETEIDWEFVRGPGGEFLGGPYDTDDVPIAYHYDGGRWSVSGSGFKGPNDAPGETVQCDGTAITSNKGIGPVENSDGSDLAGEWHRYGVWKTDDFIKWYLDGEVVASICDPAIVSQIDMYPIVNIAVGGNFPGPPTASDYPTSMLVDYITLWEPQ